MLTANQSPTCAGLGRFETDVAPCDTGFQHFAERLHAREEIAARELLDRFSVRLLSLARTRLGPQLQPKADPEDVVQSVMRTFFRRLDNSDLELRDWPSLWGLLALLTVRKCAMKCRSYRTAQRDVSREVPLQSIGELAVPSRDPTPFEVNVFVDLLERLLESSTERDRMIIEGMIAGESVASLSEQLGRTRRTIYRAADRIRQTLLHVVDEDVAVCVGASE